MKKTTIDTEWLGRNYLKITVVLLLILAVFQCNSNHELSLISDSDKKDAKKAKENALVFEKKAKSLAEKEIKYKDTIAFLDKQDQKHVAEILKNKKQVIYLKEEVKKFKSSEITNYIKDRYKASGSQVITTDLGTTVRDTIGKLIITDLIDRDGLKEENSILNKRIEVKDSTINTFKNYVDLKSEQIVALQSANSENKQATEFTENALKNTEKAFRKEKNKKNIWKSTAIGIGAVLGYLLITK